MTYLNPNIQIDQCFISTTIELFAFEHFVISDNENVFDYPKLSSF